jgi:hypothetical protein
MRVATLNPLLKMTTFGFGLVAKEKHMETAIVKHVPAMEVDMENLKKMGNMLAMSGYFEKAADPTQALAQMCTKVLAGRELGFGPFAAVNGIHIIKGKPSVSANLMASAVKSSGRYDYKVKKMDATACEVEFFEIVNGKRESLGVSSFTDKEARAAGTQNMDKFPRNMLFARAMSNGVRWYCPDVFSGNAVYVPEELGEAVDQDGNIVEGKVTVLKGGDGHVGNGSNGGSAATTDKEGSTSPVWRTWKDGNDAYKWAIEKEYYEDVDGARSSFKSMVQGMGLRYTLETREQVHQAWYESHLALADTEDVDFYKQQEPEAEPA